MAVRIEISSTLQPDDNETRQAISDTIREIVLSAIQIVGAEADDIEAIIITKQEDFGPTVHRLQAAAGLPLSYTNNEIHVAAAKTLAARHDGRVVSTILYCDNFMAEILGD